MKNALSLPGGSQEAVRGDEQQTQPTSMNTKPFFSSTQTIKVSFPQKPVVFLDVVVKRFTRGVARKPSLLSRLNRPLALLTGLLLATFGRPASAAVAGASTDLAVLVVSATTNDAALPAIRQALDFLGTP
ncbi:MAG: hypothetical protein RLZZ265_2003, partial [Verrucomicrobiota bacterium]